MLPRWRYPKTGSRFPGSWWSTPASPSRCAGSSGSRMRASEVRPPQGQVPRWGRQDVSAFRPSPRTLAFALVGVAMVGSAIVAAYWGRGHTFGLDEMAYARRLSEQSLGHALVYPPSNGYM